MSAVSERTMNHDLEKRWRFLSLSEEDNRVARISVDSLEEEEEIARRNCLFGKLLLPAITTQMVNKDALAQVWGGVDIFTITDIGDNVFLFQFATKAEKSWVMENGPWYLEEDRRRTMLVLNTVDGLEKPSGIHFSFTSFWVRFYNIPLFYMSHACARDLGTQLGFVEDVDVRGASGPGDSMGKFLRVRILLNISNPLRRAIPIAFKEGSYPIWVPIRYEKLYHFCFQCGCVDHVVTECSSLQGDSSSSTRDDQFGPWLCVDDKDQFSRLWLGTNNDASPCRRSDNSPSPPKEGCGEEGSGVAGAKCVNRKIPKPFHIMVRCAYFLVYSLNYLSYRLVAAAEEMVVPPVVVDAEYLKEIDKARQDLRALISSRHCGPVLLRLAWLDALAYDVNSNTGGPNSSIRNEKEYFCLNNAVDLCEKIKYKHQKVTYADLYQENNVYFLVVTLFVTGLCGASSQGFGLFCGLAYLNLVLAGVVAIEAIGGPIIDFVPGRKDSKFSPRNGIFPDPTKGDKSQLREIFFHMGLSDKDVVTLSGARHLMATSKTADRSSYVGLWTEDQLKFDNSYFMKLLKKESEGSELHQVDQYLLDDPVFRPYIELYAEDGDIFFRDYAVSHKRLSELGFTPSSTGCLVKKLK